VRTDSIGPRASMNRKSTQRAAGPRLSRGSMIDDLSVSDFVLQAKLNLANSAATWIFRFAAESAGLVAESDSDSESHSKNLKMKVMMIQLLNDYWDVSLRITGFVQRLKVIRVIHKDRVTVEAPPAADSDSETLANSAAAPRRGT
jgi:hypothetical protein